MGDGDRGGCEGNGGVGGGGCEEGGMGGGGGVEWVWGGVVAGVCVGGVFYLLAHLLQVCPGGVGWQADQPLPLAVTKGTERLVCRRNTKEPRPS